MDDIKLDYLERLKSLLEKEDISILNKYILKIKKNVENDHNFEEVFSEIDKKNYDLALNIVEELIYENSDREFTEEYEDEESARAMDDDDTAIGYGHEQFNDTEEY